MSLLGIYHEKDEFKWWVFRIFYVLSQFLTPSFLLASLMNFSDYRRDLDRVIHYPVTYLSFVLKDFSPCSIRPKQTQLVLSMILYRATPMISNLFFVDDSIIFSKANSEDCNAILNILKDSNIQIVAFFREILGHTHYDWSIISQG